MKRTLEKITIKLNKIINNRTIFSYLKIIIIIKFLLSQLNNINIF